MTNQLKTTRYIAGYISTTKSLKVRQQYVHIKYIKSRTSEIYFILHLSYSQSTHTHKINRNGQLRK